METEKEKLKRDRTRGTDCRRYFRAYVQIVENDFAREPPAGPIEAERRASLLLARFVKRHFYLCIRESLRSGFMTSRYSWHVNGFVITVRFSVYIKGEDRRRWLETHIGIPESPERHVKEEIQEAIDAWFGVPRLVPLKDRMPGLQQSSTPLLDLVSEDGPAHQDIRHVIAEEVAKQIKRLPRKIRALGQERVRELVVAILDNNLDGGEEKDKRIAQKYGLSGPTYSRFAGSDWRKRMKQGKKIPLLYTIIAEFLASKPEFVEAAKQYGIWQTVETVLAPASDEQEKEEKSHES